MTSIVDNPVAARVAPAAPPCRAGGPIAAAAFATLRRRMVLEHCKWDPQVGDISTLAPFPLLITADCWQQLACWAGQLTAEALEAEAEILARPELHTMLGLPRSIRKVLADRGASATPTPAAGRIMRFDFHPTDTGWQISEVNSDVPGGFTESSSFTELMVEHVPGAAPAGDPAGSWSDAIAQATHGGHVALFAAPGYMEDQQVVAYLARELSRRGCPANIVSPQQIRWRNGQAVLNAAGYCGPIDAVVRFYQGEWLPHLAGGSGWESFFVGGRTPVTNPGTALLIESKRFPLVWDQISTPMPTWRRLLPETHDPRHVPWRTDDRWLLKSAFCNNGDEVAATGWTERGQWLAARRWATWRAGGWIAQRRFTPATLPSPLGPVHVCLGVYTVDGRAAGIYGRISPSPVIDYRAIDVAVLVKDAINDT